MSRLLILLGVGAMGAWVFRRAQLPGGAFLGPLVASGLWSLASAEAMPPPALIRSVGIVLLGTSEGASVSRKVLLCALVACCRLRSC